MNTLSKQYTSKFFTSQEDYDAFKAHWSKLVNSDRKHDLTAVHHLVYLVLTGKNWHKAFSPITKQIKLDNGARSEIFRAMELFNSKYNEDYISKPFDGLVTREMLVEARKLVEVFYIVGGSYASEAYKEIPIQVGI